MNFSLRVQILYWSSYFLTQWYVGKKFKNNIHRQKSISLINIKINKFLDVAHGNFTPELPPLQETPLQSDIYVEHKEQNNLARETPISTTNQEDSTYMAVIIGVLMAVIVLLAVAIFLIVSRHRQRKCFASPLGNKSVLPGSRNHHHVSLESNCGTVEKSGTVNSYGSVQFFTLKVRGLQCCCW